MSREFTFEVQQDALAVVRNTIISANFEECEAALNEMLSPYKTLVVTEDTLSNAKADRARIRKIAARLDDARKEVKRTYTAPLAEFEEKVKRLTAICGEADQNIASQVAVFDEQRRKEKLDALRVFFQEKAGDAADYLNFDAISNPKWGNVTYGEEQARSDILREIAACHAAVGAIRTLKSPFETALLDTYRQTRDLALCMAKHEAWVKQKEAEERLRAEREAAEKAAALRKTMEAAPVNNAPEPPVAEETIEAAQDAAPVDTDPVYVIDFRVWVTPTQMDALKAFLKGNGIKYGRVPE